jgi:hypothetical protein
MPSIRILLIIGLIALGVCAMILVAPMAYFGLTTVPADGYALVNERGEPLRARWFFERPEQFMATRFVRPDAKVLELGGRYGVISVCINKRLRHPTHHVVVEPDADVLGALRRNREITGSSFAILPGILRKPGSKPDCLVRGTGLFGGYATYTKNSSSDAGECQGVPRQYSLEDAERALPGAAKFDTLVVDCEGCYIPFLQEFGRDVLPHVRTIILEDDRSTRKERLSNKSTLRAQGFVCVFEYLIWSTWVR